MKLVTRSDFDGICCAVLLKELGVIDEMVYAHPKDLQDGKVKVTKSDVLANVPYVEGCGLWFDHHSSEQERLEIDGMFEGASESAPSAARVIYNYYGGGERLSRFDQMLKYVDKVDSANLTVEEIAHPEGWVLLGFLCDPRTGLGYHQGYRISNLQLMQDLVGYIRTMDIVGIMKLPDVMERTEMYFRGNERFLDHLRQRARREGDAVVIDARGVAAIPPGNRFLVYALHPECNISVQLIDGRNREFVSIGVGHSILNRTSSVDVGSMLLRYGGGGHRVVGTCQVPYADADRVLGEILGCVKGD